MEHPTPHVEPNLNTNPEPGSGKFERRSANAVLLSHHFYDDTFPPLAIELSVEDLLPRSEIQLARRDRHHHLVSHQRALQVRVGVVFAGLVMPVIQSRRRQL